MSRSDTRIVVMDRVSRSDTRIVVMDRVSRSDTRIVVMGWKDEVVKLKPKTLSVNDDALV